MFVRKVLGSLLLFFSTAYGAAQAVNGTLLGTVADPNGAVVPNAQIIAIQVETGVVRETVTNESGNYTLPDLPPGTYSVTATVQGFKKETHANIDLQSNSSTRVDLALATGSITETVLVTTAPALLQTDRADISTKLETEQIEDLPIGGSRNFQSLLNLVPGTSPATFQHSQFFNAQSALQTEANGIPRMGNLYQIEGIDDDERTGLLQIIIPPAEAIQSVDISTNNFEAELGRATGAVTNVTLKSGIQRLSRLRVRVPPEQLPSTRAPTSAARSDTSAYNYFGGSIGGPVLKDKLFFFGDYLRTSDHENIGNTFTMPASRLLYTVTATRAPSTLARRSLSAQRNQGQVYDPNYRHRGRR